MGATGERVRVFGAEAIVGGATGGPANDGERSRGILATIYICCVRRYIRIYLARGLSERGRRGALFHRGG